MRVRPAILIVLACVMALPLGAGPMDENDPPRMPTEPRSDAKTWSFGRTDTRVRVVRRDQATGDPVPIEGARFWRVEPGRSGRKARQKPASERTDADGWTVVSVRRRSKEVRDGSGAIVSSRSRTIPETLLVRAPSCADLEIAVGAWNGQQVELDCTAR